MIRKYTILALSLVLVFTAIVPNVEAGGGLVYTSQNPGSTEGSSKGGTSRAQSRDVAIALSLAITVGVTTKAILDPSKKTETFQQRFRAAPRAMSTDLKRLSGPHYTWLVRSGVFVKSRSRKQFRCILQAKKKRLKHLVNQARQTLQRDDIEKLHTFFQNAKVFAHDLRGKDFCTL